MYLILNRAPPLRLSLCICCCWIILFAQPILSQPLPQSSSISDSHKRLLDLNKVLLTTGRDLTQLRNALDKRDPERHIASSLIDSSLKSASYVRNAIDVLWLYQSMSSARDRENVLGYIGMQLKALAKLLDIEIEAANDAIANTDKPGIVSTATELRNATRQIIDVLNAVRL